VMCLGFIKRWTVETRNEYLARRKALNAETRFVIKVASGSQVRNAKIICETNINMLSPSS
jgi:hypothetical protein